MKEYLLPCGRVTQVDDEDFFGLLQWKWQSHETKSGWYACRRIKTATPSIVYLHRFIMNVPDGLEIDHIDGNTLNNQRCNLQICNTRINQLNQHRVRGVVKFPGVTLTRNGKYEAKIRTPFGRWNLGVFGTPEDAHAAYQHELANQKRITV